MTVSQKPNVIVKLIKPGQDILLRENLKNRGIVANNIGVSFTRAVLFPTAFLRALTRRGNLFIAERGSEIVGAAFIKLVHKKSMGELIERQNWAILYGIDAKEDSVFRSLLQHVLDVNNQHGIKRLYLGKGLRRNAVAALRTSVIHREARILHAIDFDLSFEESPQQLSFLA